MEYPDNHYIARGIGKTKSMNDTMLHFGRQLAALVLPITIQNLISASAGAADVFMLSFIGQTAIAGVSLASQLVFVHQLFLSTIILGTTMLASQYWGKQDSGAVEKILGIALGVSVPVSFVFFIISFCFSAFFMGLFSTDILSMMRLDEGAEKLLSLMLLINAYYVIGKTINTTVIVGIFCAGGDSRFGLINDIFTMWVYAVPSGLLTAFVFHLSPIAVYFILFLDEFVKMPFIFRHYFKYGWLKNITRP
jgi:Na+-driven multidrug efflux pump